MTMIDMTNPVNRTGVQLAALRGALRLEVLGMRGRPGRPVLALANEAMGTNFRRKADALEALEAFYAEWKEANGIG